ncbi:MAG: hypothetical protein QNI84_14835 [Henriciella sp.]|nr:hypothetical protein [Henriciella sp.]
MDSVFTVLLELFDRLLEFLPTPWRVPVGIFLLTALFLLLLWGLFGWARRQQPKTVQTAKKQGASFDLVRRAVNLGFSLGRFEFLDGSQFQEAIAAAPAARDEITQLLNIDPAIPVSSDKTAKELIASVLVVLSARNAAEHGALLTGICAQRTALVGASKDNSNNEQVRLLAEGTLGDAASTVIPDRRKLFRKLLSTKDRLTVVDVSEIYWNQLPSS